MSVCQLFFCCSRKKLLGSCLCRIPVSRLGGEVCVSAPQCLQSDLQQRLQHQKEQLLCAVGISMA